MTRSGWRQHFNRQTMVRVGFGGLALVIIVVAAILIIDNGDGQFSGTPEATEVSVDSISKTPTTDPLIATTFAPSTTLSLNAVPDNQSITISGVQNGIYSNTLLSSTLINDQVWEIAFRLDDGSYIAQHTIGNYGSTGDTDIYRIAAEVTTFLAANSPTRDVKFHSLRLHDVFTKNGTPFAVVTVKTGYGFDDATEELFIVNINSGEKVSYDYIGGWENGPGQLSYGAGQLVGEFYSAGSHGPYFLTLEGMPIQPSDYGLADFYEDCEVCPTLFTVDSTGEQFAWIEGDLLVVVDIKNTERVAEIALPAGSGANITSIEISGTLALINSLDPTTGLFKEPLLITFAGTSAQMSIPGLATLDM